MNNDVIKAMVQGIQRQWVEGIREARDTFYCRNCGKRSEERREVRQAERGECCVYVCTVCDEVADPTPF